MTLMHKLTRYEAGDRSMRADKEQQINGITDHCRVLVFNAPLPR